MRVIVLLALSAPGAAAPPPTRVDQADSLDFEGFHSDEAPRTPLIRIGGHDAAKPAPGRNVFDPELDNPGGGATVSVERLDEAPGIAPAGSRHNAVAGVPPGEGEPLLHPPAEPGDAVVGPGGEIEPLEQLGDTGRNRPRLEVEQLREEAEVLGCGQALVEGRRFGEDAGPCPDLVAGLDRIEAQHPDRPGARFQQAVQDPDRRRLPGTVMTEQPHDVAPGDLEGQVVDRPHLAEGSGQVLDDDGGGWVSCRQAGRREGDGRRRRRASPWGPGR